MNTKTIGLIGTLIKVIIAVVGVIFCVLIIMNSDDIMAGNKMSFVDGGLTISYIAMFLCIGVALIAGVIYFLKNIKKSKGLLIGLVGFGIITAISYATASNEVTEGWKTMGVDASTSQLSGMGITLCLVLLGIAVVAALFSEVSKLIK